MSCEAIDVLCVGHASYDLIVSVPYHPAADEKIVASHFSGCGGGPAANAAITVSRLGLKAAFAGYLGQDLYGDKHWQEFAAEKITTKLIVRGRNPTPLSSILVKPNGKRSLINYKGDTRALPAGSIDFSSVSPKVILFDGHEPQVSLDLLKLARKKSIPTVLDAGSLHEGTEQLMDKVDYLVCSEKFAKQFAEDENSALDRLVKISNHVVITLGEKGLIWQCENERGNMPAFPVTAIDTTGAGDAFHGAFSAAVAMQMNWLEVLRYASTAGALCCTKIGARSGLPSRSEHSALYKPL
jgi:sulfofructose kinase